MLLCFCGLLRVGEALTLTRETVVHRGRAGALPEASDAGASEAEIAAITESETQVVFMANGVWIQGGGLDEPYAPPAPEGPCPLDKEPNTSEDR